MDIVKSQTMGEIWLSVTLYGTLSAFVNTCRYMQTIYLVNYNLLHSADLLISSNIVFFFLESFALITSGISKKWYLNDLKLVSTYSQNTLPSFVRCSYGSFLLSGATGLGCSSHTKEMQLYLEGQWGRGMEEGKRAKELGQEPQTTERSCSQCENMRGGGRPGGSEGSENTVHRLVLKGLAVLIAMAASGWSECNDLVTLVSGRYHSTAEFSQKSPLLPEASEGKEVGLHALRILYVGMLSGNVHDLLEKEEPYFLTKQPFPEADLLYPCSINLPPLEELNLVQTFL